MTILAPQIIVRAFNNEPIVFHALQMHPSGRYVNVSRDYPPLSYIGWPIEDAFDYDIDDFQRLWETFSVGDKDKLSKLYDELRQQPRVFMDLLDEQGPFK